MRYRASTDFLLPGETAALQITPQDPGSIFYTEIMSTIEEGSTFEIIEVQVGTRSQFVAPGGSLSASMFRGGFATNLFDGCVFPQSFLFRVKNVGPKQGRLTIEIDDGLRGDAPRLSPSEVFTIS